MKNTFKVDNETWKRWGADARETFNRQHAFMLKNADLFEYPGADSLPKEHWKTVAWNAAYIAADIADGKIPVVRGNYMQGLE